MILPSDADYEETKLIKQGKKVLKTPFKELAEWISKEYEVNVLNVYYDLIEPNKSPRLNVIFEYLRDESKFMSGEYIHYDKNKQRIIADKFRELTEPEALGTKGLFSKMRNTISNLKYDTRDIWVTFSSFEGIAKIEANDSIPNEQIQKLKKRLNNKDIWEISRCFSGVTFFFYKDEQVKENSQNGMKEKLTEEYYSLLKQYDEFDYFNKEYFSIYMDSKENFDNNYQSNWFYYYK